MPRIGPTGRYPLGKPLERSDKGHMDIAFSVVPPRHGKLEFGTYLDWFFLTPPVALTLTTAIRTTLAEAYGAIQPEESLPFRVSCETERGVVMVEWRRTTPQIVETAEVWIALMDRIDHERRRLSL